VGGSSIGDLVGGSCIGDIVGGLLYLGPCGRAPVLGTQEDMLRNVRT